ncbi:hypothetical protein ASPZODRAFT_17290 [Penicilliopsis zonata CBS 506.65]|uniref:Extracellular membrane protein CFEM domain-containing protein n=1 Tax=Penicilliopsis zonata CBS 506.65 TaxID=1073090 RepID=A0A1L9SFH0_9EURO|nr:hypothetical protein ASPZODRAFT_17290 [Penicilliopsis zonata CBS 506.65]OJJ45853.1 hypothetical protein ASPZODRAFT_17290 [Penicilliopsis zonata CBS 506.65]
MRFTTISLFALLSTSITATPVPTNGLIPRTCIGGSETACLEAAAGTCDGACGANLSCVSACLEAYQEQCAENC